MVFVVGFRATCPQRCEMCLGRLGAKWLTWPFPDTDTVLAGHNSCAQKKESLSWAPLEFVDPACTNRTFKASTVRPANRRAFVNQGSALSPKP